MIPFYLGPETDCVNCINCRMKDDGSGEMYCAGRHTEPKPWEHCRYQKNEYKKWLEIIDEWLKKDDLTEEQKMELLERKKEYEQKDRRLEEIDRDRRTEEAEINKRGLDEIFADALEDNAD